jgi:pimeloyl-ACP methyl ester carboxylesterase
VTTVPNSYRQDMQRAWERIAAIPPGKLEVRLGTVEYAERGAGLPVLVCHGVLGCHADGVDGWWTNMLGEGYRVIAPARFGYFGSTLPKNTTPADQAHAYALLLDHLGVGRAAVIGYSAGSASVLEFARRHPDRVVGLILANCRLGGPTPNPMLKPVLGVVYRSQWLFWLYRRLLPSTYARMIRVPKGYQPTPDEAATIRAVSELQFPLTPRQRGAVFDGFVSNLAADRFPLEELTVPTLIVSAADDPWARHPYAVEAEARIPAAELVTIDRGGHLFLGHDAHVRAAIGPFLASLRKPEGGQGECSVRVSVLHEG